MRKYPGPPHHSHSVPPLGVSSYPSRQPSPSIPVKQDFPSVPPGGFPGTACPGGCPGLAPPRRKRCSHCHPVMNGPSASRNSLFVLEVSVTLKGILHTPNRGVGADVTGVVSAPEPPVAPIVPSGNRALLKNLPINYPIPPLLCSPHSLPAPHSCSDSNTGSEVMWVFLGLLCSTWCEPPALVRGYHQLGGEILSLSLFSPPPTSMHHLA